MTSAPAGRDVTDTQPVPVISSPARGRHAAPSRHPVYRARLLRAGCEVLIVAGVAIAAVVVVSFFVRPVHVSDDAMEPTLSAGERVLITSWGAPSNGDVVIVRGRGPWGTDGEDLVARIIGLPGQRVSCCDAQGRIMVDGQPLNEPYVVGPTDQVTFDIVVPEGRAFVLVDRREAARDGRLTLDTESGTIDLDDVTARVLAVAWPPRVPV